MDAITPKAQSPRTSIRIWSSRPRWNGKQTRFPGCEMKVLLKRFAAA